MPNICWALEEECVLTFVNDFVQYLLASKLDIHFYLVGLSAIHHPGRWLIDPAYRDMTEFVSLGTSLYLWKANLSKLYSWIAAVKSNAGIEPRGLTQFIEWRLRIFRPVTRPVSCLPSQECPEHSTLRLSHSHRLPCFIEARVLSNLSLSCPKLSKRSR